MIVTVLFCKECKRIGHISEPCICLYCGARKIEVVLMFGKEDAVNKLIEQSVPEESKA